MDQSSDRYEKVMLQLAKRLVGSLGGCADRERQRETERDRERQRERERERERETQTSGTSHGGCLLDINGIDFAKGTVPPPDIKNLCVLYVCACASASVCAHACVLVYV